MKIRYRQDVCIHCAGDEHQHETFVTTCGRVVIGHINRGKMAQFYDESEGESGRKELTRKEAEALVGFKLP